MKPVVILLAAGKCSRMAPLTEKPLINFLGKELIAHQVENIAVSGLQNFIVVGNDDNIEKIKAALAPYKKLNFHFAVQKNLAEGIMGGVMAAQPFLPAGEAVLVVSANDYVEKFLFEKLFSEAKKSSANTLIVGKKVENYFPGGYLELKDQKMIKTIVEKPEEGKEPSDLVALVIQFFKNPAALFVAYQKVAYQKDDGHEQALQILFDTEKNAEIVQYEGFWQAIKYPFHQLALMEHFLCSLKKSFIHPKAQIAKTAVIKGHCYLEEGVRVMDLAVLSGPVYIGKSTVVGNHTLIRNAHIGEHCVIGHTTEVARSYLGDHVWTHQNFIGDSVFADNVSLGAGARTGNLRLDEANIFLDIKGQKVDSGSNKLGAFIGKNVRIGINTSLMPGVKIGARSFIGSSLIVDKDVPENVFVKTKNTLSVVKNLKTAPKRGNY